jgi:hypothetical protein
MTIFKNPIELFWNRSKQRIYSAKVAEDAVKQVRHAEKRSRHFAHTDTSGNSTY